MSTNHVRQINDRNQITIPPELLRRMGIQPGDLVHMSLTEQGIALQPVDVVERKPITASNGQLTQAA